ncbi:MAG: glycerate kinase [Clostridia bacterium]|nr:glycerate kinase [Clostridia bacterium]
MNIVIAIDSFKGSLSSVMAGNAVAEGIKRIDKDAETNVVSIADGGEGTVESLVLGRNGKKRKITVTDPLGRKIECEYGIIDNNTAAIEMSAAAGITLLEKSELNPLYTTTYGVGEIIRDAIEQGCRDFVIGIGGSATNDGGIGMLQALGFGILDRDGRQVRYGALGLKDVETITAENAMPFLSECNFNIACDVKNPLCFENGCSAVFARQKGADDRMIADMDGWLYRYSGIVKKTFPKADIDKEGAGAAGGLGYAFMSFLNGKLGSGIDLVLSKVGVEEKIENADLVITGEGRLDGQTVMGKAPIGIARIAKKYGKTVIAFSGCTTRDARVCNEHGIDAFFPILRGICTLDEAMNTENAFCNLADTAEQVYRLYNINRGV